MNFDQTQSLNRTTLNLASLRCLKQKRICNYSASSETDIFAGPFFESCTSDSGFSNARNVGASLPHEQAGAEGQLTSFRSFLPGSRSRAKTGQTAVLKVHDADAEYPASASPRLLRKKGSTSFVEPFF
jgi:hypothetical protein